MWLRIGMRMRIEKDAETEMTPTSFGSGICWQAKREMNGVLLGLVEFMEAVFRSSLTGTGIKRFRCGMK